MKGNHKIPDEMKGIYLICLTLLIASCNSNTDVKKTYYDNHNLKEIDSLKNGLKNGICIEYYKNGKTSSLFHYNAGRLNGNYENGGLEKKGNYKDGKLDGKFFWLSINGDTIDQFYYDTGTQVIDIRYNLQGQRILYTDFKKKTITTYDSEGVKLYL